MNAYKLNGFAGHQFRKAVCDGLNISHSEIYKVIESISNDGTIKLKSGNKYKLELKRIQYE